jgi:hypothetical protein
MTSLAEPIPTIQQSTTAPHPNRTLALALDRGLTTIDVIPTIHRPHLAIRDKPIGRPSYDACQVRVRAGVGGGDGEGGEWEGEEGEEGVEFHPG